MVCKPKIRKVSLFISFLLIIFVCINILQHRGRIISSILSRDSDSRNASRVQFSHAFDYNWTIILSVNKGFHDFFSNWWWHFQRLGINVPIIVVAEDDVVYTKLQEEFQYHGSITVTIERSSGVAITEAVRYGTDEYKKLVSARATHILKHLQEGFNVIYSDIDTVWLKNPFPYFNGNYDMWIEQRDGHFCTGFMAINSNNKTVKLMSDWEQSLYETLQVNQPIFNKILRASNVRFKPLNETVFPTGRSFNNYKAQLRSQVVVMHNTFVFGHQNKLLRFKILNLWFQTM